MSLAEEAELAEKIYAELEAELNKDIYGQTD